MSEACLKDAVLQIDIGVKSKWHIPLKNAPLRPISRVIPLDQRWRQSCDPWAFGGCLGCDPGCLAKTNG